jgi:integrase
VLEEIGCGWARLHAFRPTFVSLAIDGGVTNVVLLGRWLAHTSPKITLDVYSHRSRATSSRRR